MEFGHANVVAHTQVLGARVERARGKGRRLVLLILHVLEFNNSIFKPGFQGVMKAYVSG